MAQVFTASLQPPTQLLQGALCTQPCLHLLITAPLPHPFQAPDKWPLCYLSCGGELCLVVSTTTALTPIIVHLFNFLPTSQLCFPGRPRLIKLASGVA